MAIKLSILTFNTLGVPFFARDITKRYKKTAELINSADYDVVCLQELFTYYHVSIFKRIMKKYPHVLFQKNPFGPRGGLVIFSKNKLVNPAFFTFSYPKNAHIPLYTKIAQQGILSADIDQTAIRIITTHLTSDTVHDLKPHNKLYTLIKNQSKEVITLINNYSQTEKLLIIAGDFNIAKHSELYNAMLKNAKLNDTFEKDETPTYSPQRIPYFYAADADRCDYIFTKSGDKKITVIKTDSAFVEKESLSNGKKSFLSDHIALHCILEVND